MLIINQLHKRYRDHVALQALNISIAPGEVYALLGPNGAGKTTTINCCLGFVQPDGGQVLVDGIDSATSPDAARRRLAYIPEQVNLYDNFSGAENLRYFTELSGQRRTPAMLDGFLLEAGLAAEVFDRPVRGYSKGMRQKVGVAIALAKDARVLLLDEPTSGLDPSASHEFSATLMRLSARGVATLMATHDLFRALDVATTIGILIDGRLNMELNAADLTPQGLEQAYLSATAS